MNYSHDFTKVISHSPLLTRLQFLFNIVLLSILCNYKISYTGIVIQMHWPLSCNINAFSEIMNMHLVAEGLN